MPILLAAEQELNKKNNMSPQHALNVNTRPQTSTSTDGMKQRRFHGMCHNCGKKGHMRRECRGPKSRCQKCGNRGHKTEFCYSRKKAFPEDNTPQGNQTDRGTPKDSRDKKVAFSMMASASFGAEHDWIIDSGCTMHICKDKGLFRTLSTRSDIQIFGCSGDALQAQGIGTVDIPLHTIDGNAVIITLQNVLYCPTSVANLFSMKACTGHGYTVNIKHDDVTIYNGSRALFSATLLEDGLWHMGESVRPIDEAICLVSKASSNAAIWHRRYGHINYDSLAELVSSGAVRGIQVSAADFTKNKNELCEPCVKGKMTRLPFQHSDSTTSSPMELLHSDLMIINDPQWLDEGRVVCTLLDDHSKLCVVIPMRHKSDVATEVPKVITLLENQTGRKLRRFRSDRGGEYVNKTLKAYFEGKGVHHELSMAYTPQQNGAAERLNRTLMEKTRNMLFDAKLGGEMGIHAISTAAHLKNRSMAWKGSGATPIELFFGYKPDVSGLRVFGSRCCIKIPQANAQGKVGPRGRLGKMIGYSMQSKGYKILLDNGKIVESRDVQFYEADSAETTKDEGMEEEESLTSDLQYGSTLQGSIAQNQIEEPMIDTIPITDEIEEHIAHDDEDQAVHAEPASLEGEENLQTQTGWRSQRVRHSPYRFVPGLISYEGVKEPENFHEAITSPQSANWWEAMKDEMTSHSANGTWKLIPRKGLAPGIVPNPSRWTYKLKRNSEGEVVRFKARLVAKGCRQRAGLDYEELFAPVAKVPTFRLLMAIAAREKWHTKHVDIKTAFLYGELQEEVFMEQPEGFEVKDHICLLEKAMYGLKQASRVWYLRLRSVLENMGFQISDHDAGLFIMHHQDAQAYIAVWVDNIIMCSPKAEVLELILAQLREHFEANDLGQLHWYLGIKVEMNLDNQMVMLSQHSLAQDILDEAGLRDCNAVKTAFPVNTKLIHEGEAENETKYR